jgi:hypothetical protein
MGTKGFIGLSVDENARPGDGNAASAKELRRGVQERRIGINSLARAAQHLTKGATTTDDEELTHDGNIPGRRSCVNVPAQVRPVRSDDEASHVDARNLICAVNCSSYEVSD